MDEYTVSIIVAGNQACVLLKYGTEIQAQEAVDEMTRLFNENGKLTIELEKPPEAKGNQPRPEQ